jgi:hypothetical protein
MTGPEGKLRGEIPNHRCPNAGETYRHHNDVTERHPVSVSENIEIHAGQPVLVLKASCPCGWSASNVIGGDE